MADEKMDINARVEMAPGSTTQFMRRAWQDKWMPTLLLVGFLIQTVAMVFWVVSLWEQTYKLRQDIVLIQADRYTTKDALRDVGSNTNRIEYNTQRIDLLIERVNKLEDRRNR